MKKFIYTIMAMVAMLASPMVAQAQYYAAYPAPPPVVYTTPNYGYYYNPVGQVVSTALATGVAIGGMALFYNNYPYHNWYGGYRGYYGGYHNWHGGYRGYGGHHGRGVHRGWHRR